MMGTINRGTFEPSGEIGCRIRVDTRIPEGQLTLVREALMRRAIPSVTNLPTGVTKIKESEDILVTFPGNLNNTQLMSGLRIAASRLYRLGYFNSTPRVPNLVHPAS